MDTPVTDVVAFDAEAFKKWNRLVQQTDGRRRLENPFPLEEG